MTLQMTVLERYEVKLYSRQTKCKKCGDTQAFFRLHPERETVRLHCANCNLELKMFRRDETLELIEKYDVTYISESDLPYRQLKG